MCGNDCGFTWNKAIPVAEMNNNLADPPAGVSHRSTHRCHANTIEFPKTSRFKLRNQLL